MKYIRPTAGFAWDTIDAPDTRTVVVRDLIYSPDDNGWYAQETNLDTGKSRVTKLTYPTKEALEIMLRATFSKYRWEKWQ